VRNQQGPSRSEFAFIRKTRGTYRIKATVLSHLYLEGSPAKTAFDCCGSVSS
jgi:hypothetical protein